MSEMMLFAATHLLMALMCLGMIWHLLASHGRRQAWEYMSCILPMEGHIERMEEFGDAGWELCSAELRNNFDEANRVGSKEKPLVWFVCIFKRKL